MPQKTPLIDHEPVTRQGVSGVFGTAAPEDWSDSDWTMSPPSAEVIEPGILPTKQSESATPAPPYKREVAVGQRGHVLSFAGLFLFTVIVYVRPYEVVKSLSWLSGAAFWIALVTIVIFIPTQFMLEGKLTARPREVNLVLVLCLLALLSMPLATSRGDAWDEFNSVFTKVVLMFVIMVNVVRTRLRLTSLLVLGLAIASYVSVNAINDYRLGHLEEQGVRIEGSLGGMLQNPNDLALYLVTMVPIPIGLLLSSRGILKKTVYAFIGILMVVAIIVTFSRGGFIGLVAAFMVLGFKLGRKHKTEVIIVGVLCVVLFVVFAPGKYGTRIASIFGTDPTGSADQRRQLLIKSFIVSLRHPLLGVGMGNFHIYSDHEQVSHNSYTQVSAEMGLTAALIYTMFIVTPLRKLRRLESETFEARRKSKAYYLSVVLQASLIGYMFASFFVSVAYLWYIYYLVGYAVCVQRVYGAEARPAPIDQTALGNVLRT